MTHRLRGRVQAGEPVLGTLALLGDPFAVEAMGHAGLDWVILDMEHTDRDMSQISGLIRAAETSGVTPLVRLPSLDAKQVQRALDSGAKGIVIPTVRSRAEAESLVQSVSYPPQGVRGTCRYSRAAAAGKYEFTWDAFTNTANDEIITMALVEDEEGAAALEDIVELVDVVLIGRGDLSTSLGLPGQPNHPRVLEVVDRYERAARRLSRPIAAMCYSAEEARAAVARGATFLMFSADVNILYRTYAEAAAAMPSSATPLENADGGVR